MKSGQFQLLLSELKASEEKKEVVLKSRKNSLKNYSQYYARLCNWNTYKLVWVCYQLPVYSNAMPPKTCCFPEVVILCIRTKGKEEKREITEKCSFKINTENKTEVAKKPQTNKKTQWSKLFSYSSSRRLFSFKSCSINRHILSPRPRWSS